MHRRHLLLSALAAPLILTAMPARAAKPPVFADQGLAIRGYDPVCYFTEGRAMRGTAGNAVDWHGATWRFVSDRTRAIFEGDPRAYLPEYGGYCAWAVSLGYTAGTDPHAWHIESGRLYLNYSLAVQKRWSRNMQGNIARADANWPGVLTG
jgi:hypothetical protein